MLGNTHIGDPFSFSMLPYILNDYIGSNFELFLGLMWILKSDLRSAYIYCQLLFPCFLSSWHLIWPTFGVVLDFKGQNRQFLGDEGVSKTVLEFYSYILETVVADIRETLGLNIQGA